MVERILAVDIGGSKLLTAVVEVTSSILGRVGTVSSVARRDLRPDSSKEDILAAILSASDETCSLFGFSVSQLNRIGMTIPGLADPQKGEWVYAPFSGIKDFPIRKILYERWKKDILIENDVNACAWGEKIFGVCRSLNDFLWVTVSNGIGGGLVLNGHIYSGAYNGAAEIGHCSVEEDGALCGCGNYGCLEAEAAGPAIARRFASPQNRMDSSDNHSYSSLLEKLQLPSSKDLTAAQIALLAREGYLPAQKVFDKTGFYLGKGMALAANLVNPSAIVIGGGVVGSFDLFEPKMKETFYARLFRGANPNIQILKTGLGYEAGLLAAASLGYSS